jgi:hypothetical protein
VTKQCSNSAVPIYFAVFALFYAVLPGAGGTEVKSYDWECSEATQVCSWREAVVTPPKGWIEDEGWTRHYQALVLFENGDKSVKKPVMFLRAHNGDGELTLEEYIGVAQDRLKKRASDASIEPLPDFKRAGKPSFKVFLYKKPSAPDQEFELIAFVKDTGAADPQESHFFQAVLSSPSMEEIERAKPAFYELLRNL